jgi:hypothetical protein
VLRGTLRWQRGTDGTARLVLPAKVVASEHLSDDLRQMFRFTLRPGRYVLTGFYDGSAFTYRQVSVLAGRVIRVDLPDLCK